MSGTRKILQPDRPDVESFRVYIKRGRVDLVEPHLREILDWIDYLEDRIKQDRLTS